MTRARLSTFKNACTTAHSQLMHLRDVGEATPPTHPTPGCCRPRQTTRERLLPVTTSTL